MREMFWGGAAQEEEQEINVTPMLDVVFIMLIFFIVTASFVKESGLGVNRPPISENPPPVKEESNIVLTIAANNEIRINRRRIDIRQVGANIRRLKAELPDASIVVMPDKASNINTLVKVMDASREVGEYNVSLSARYDD